MLFGFALQAAHAQQSASIAEAFRWQANLVEVKAYDPQGIPFLKWSSTKVLIESTATLYYTNLKGRFSEKITQATLNSKKIPVNKEGGFYVHFGFPKESKTFVITATDANNKVYRMQYKIVSTDKQEAALEKAVPRRWRFNAGAGITRLSFRQKLVEPFNQFALTVKGGFAYRLFPETLDFSTSAFFNAFPFLSTSSTYKIQYIGVNSRLVWNLITSNPLRVNVSAGVYYNTSISTVGFTNMYGPQLYPEFIYIFDDGTSLLLYGKFSPAFSQTTKISLKDNREVAGGMHYSFPISFTTRMSVGVDISQLSLSIASGDWATTNTYSLSAGLSF